GGRLFYERNNGRQPQPVLYAQDTTRDSPRAVLDPNRISPDGSTAVREYAVSPDGRLLAYMKSRGGSGIGETRVRDLASGRDLRESVPGTLNAVCWTRDGRGFFSVRAPDPEPGNTGAGARVGKQVFYHVLGQDPSRDRLVHEWKDNARWVYCMLSADGRRAIVVAERGLDNELYMMDLGDPKRPDTGAPLVRLLGDVRALLTPVDTVGSTLYVRTNLEAPRARIVALDLAEKSPRPRAIVPESSEVIVDAVVAGD